MSQCSDPVVQHATGHGKGRGICPIGMRQSWQHSLFYRFEYLGLGHRIALRKELKRKIAYHKESIYKVCRCFL